MPSSHSTRKVEHDAPRLLAVRSELGYTDRPDRAMQDEPEAVSKLEQRAITEQSHRSHAQLERAAWVDTRDTIRAKLATLTGSSFDSSRSELRAILRLLERVDKTVARA
jgi:hypothetical protein